MDWKEQIQEQLDRGFSKYDLEKLIGLPENNLSGALKGTRSYSKKNMLKIERWLAGEKPDPLSVFFAPKEKKVTTKEKVTDNKNPVNVAANGKIQKMLSDLKNSISNNPPKLEGESSIEYRLRMIELSENKTK